MSASDIIGYHLVEGGDEKVIILHGWWSDHSCYRGLTPFLDKATFSYAFADHRGYGKSAGLSGAHSIAEISGDLQKLAAHLGWRKFHIIGHSMGGMAVQRLAADAPHVLKSAVAITPVPACGSPLDADGKALFHNAAEKDENRAAILKFLTSGRYSDAWYGEVVRRSRETTDKQAFHEYMLAWTETDFAARTRGNPTPLLALVGEQDGAITPDAIAGTILDWFPNSEMEILKASGHFPMLETPAMLITAMEAFMKRHR